MPKRNGWTVTLSTPVTVETSAAIGGVKEEDGPLGGCFDILLEDDRFGEESWERAESKMQREVYLCALNKANLAANDIDYILAGDLLNQCIGSSFGLRESGRAFFGLYGACSTMAESLMLGSFLVSGGFASHVAAITSSHFATAERQFRNPLEYGGQRTPSAQWTATAAGCAILGSEPKAGGVQITKLTAGRIVDMGIKDANNMGAAMAPDDVKIRPYLSGIGVRNLDSFSIVIFALAALKMLEMQKAIFRFSPCQNKITQSKKLRHTQTPIPTRVWSFSTHKST